MKEMMIDENEKKKDEKFLTDLCECYLFLHYKCVPDELLSICVPCLLKAALKKEECEEAQKEKEIALLALSHIDRYYFFRQELFLNEIKEIIQHHQEHRNLTQLAYQSAWTFLMNRLYYANNLESLIVNELHFGREAARELDELAKSVSRKIKEEDEIEKEGKEVFIIREWFCTINYFLSSCKLWNAEFVKLIGSIVRVFLFSKDNHRRISIQCVYLVSDLAKNRNIGIEALMDEGAIDLFSEEMNQSTLKVDTIGKCLFFFMNASERLKEKTDGEAEEAKRKTTKRKVFEKLEKEGFEDIITSLYGEISLINENVIDTLSINVYDYFVNI
ncbi:uncharacterized protein MONOS_18347 [Monocercomonoides exilis]|uniref:uncharacterized protein n=1 Tax=Monocercomonoides exilis TaxID=2049356 RepID=UPI0035599A4E|nr:hypothetical protein MONOS_18347 [Monocercomonoides exilis]